MGNWPSDYKVFVVVIPKKDWRAGPRQSMFQIEPDLSPESDKYSVVGVTPTKILRHIFS